MPSEEAPKVDADDIVESMRAHHEAIARDLERWPYYQELIAETLSESERCNVCDARKWELLGARPRPIPSDPMLVDFRCRKCNTTMTIEIRRTQG